MQILNPLYDSAFKYLMEDNNIAKIILSIILDADVVSLQAKPQETSVNNGLMRFDYKAVVQYATGEYKTILIEVQKYNSPNPIRRFRKYLGLNYTLTETILTEDGEKEDALPLVAVYILGFDLSEFDCRIVRVDNRFYDVVGEKILNVKSNFVEKLNHTSYILIAKNKNVTFKNTLVEQLLELFIQKMQGEESNFIIEISEQNFNEKLIPVIERLKRATLDEDLLRKVELEQDYIDTEISKNQQLKEAIAKLEEERRQKEETKINFAKKMLEYGEPISAIIEATGLDEEAIKKLK